MPNWCSNTLNVVGKQSELEKFEKAVSNWGIKTKSVFDFNKIIPYPEEFIKQDKINERYEKLQVKYSEKKITLKEKKELLLLKLQNKDCDKDGYNQGGYDWCCNYWGTKWNACEPELTKKRGRLVYGFDTAWGPALPVINKIILMFPELSIKLKYTLEGDKKGYNYP